MCFYAFTKTSVAGAVIMSATSRLSGCLAESFGPEAEASTGEPTQGYSNATVDTSQALWEIAQIASRSPDLRDLVLNADLSIISIILDLLAQVEGGAEFRSALDDFLRSFGWRGEGWDAASPTWMEQPARPLGIIRRVIIDETPSTGFTRTPSVVESRLPGEQEQRIQPLDHCPFRRPREAEYS